MAYDDILQTKIKLERLELKQSRNPREDWVRLKEAKIMTAILRSGDDGISHGALATIIRIDRKNLRGYTKRLIDKGLVTRLPGRHGRYYPTTKARRTRILSTHILSEFFVSKILGFDTIQLPQDVMDIPLLDRNSEDYFLEHALLTFSNGLGGFLTYVLIQAMNPANKLTEGSKNSVEQDVMVQTWLEDLISMIVPSLIRGFKYWIGSGLYFLGDDIPPNATPSELNKLYDKEAQLFLKFLYNRPYATIDQRLIFQLNVAFHKLFPKLHSKLEKIMHELPKLTEQKKDHLKYLGYKNTQRETCSHKYEPVMYQNELFHCPKCHHTKGKTS
jgi:DNA-binding MarR family transcriptional regulator